jgi:nitric oxide reductase subunit C
MTKRQTRLFFIVGTTLSAVAFLALTIQSHTQFGALTHADQLNERVIAGKHVWHRKDCINCHTLLGEGAYYAPDLTKIAQQRGAAYLTQFLKNPSLFYSEARNGRLMPNPNLTDVEIRDLIEFLTWVSRIDNQGWPPRPILVSGLPQSVNVGGPQPEAASSDAVAQGEALFRKSPPACFACHSLQAGTVLVGPSLAGIGTRAAQTIGSPSYTGSAQTPADYIRESIQNPSAYLVPGPTFSAGGQSIMPPFGDTLTSAESDQLVAYLATFK